MFHNCIASKKKEERGCGGTARRQYREGSMKTRSVMGTVDDHSGWGGVRSGEASSERVR